MSWLGFGLLSILFNKINGELYFKSEVFDIVYIDKTMTDKKKHLQLEQ